VPNKQSAIVGINKIQKRDFHLLVDFFLQIEASNCSSCRIVDWFMVTVIIFANFID